MSKTKYTENTSDNTMLVEREFNGTVEQVWRAWTESDLLAEWWAPEPFKAITKTMDFREGGHWHYYMLGPDGSKFWCMLHYLQIKNLEWFTGKDSFADENGNDNTDLPGMHWKNTFTSGGAGTIVTVLVTFSSKEDMQKITEMGFKEGFAMAHDNLDKLLKEMK